jgi:hypothetical protein
LRFSLPRASANSASVLPFVLCQATDKLLRGYLFVAAQFDKRAEIDNLLSASISARGVYRAPLFQGECLK